MPSLFQFNTDADNITAKWRKHNVASDMAIYLTRDDRGVLFKNIGVSSGDATEQAIPMAHGGIPKETQRNKGVKRDLPPTHQQDYR